VSAFRHDIKHTLRGLRAAPFFFAATVLTLAVGIGANTALFSIVKTVLLEPLPYPEPERLVMLESYPWTPVEIIRDLRKSGRAFESIAAFYPRAFAISGGERPQELIGAEATPGLLRLFPARLALGRGFTPADAQPGAAPTVIINQRIWEARYGGTPDVIGRTLTVDGRAHQIIGVLEPGFRQIAPRTGEPEFWIPYEPQLVRADGELVWAALLGRLRDRVSLRQAQAELDAALARFQRRHPEFEGPRWDRRFATMKSVLVKNVRTALLVLQLAVGAVLLIACVNVANLLLARLSSRRKELAIRAALGAGRSRLLRQLLTESLTLAAIGGLAGLGLMLLMLRLLLRAAPPDIPRIAEVGVDVPVLLFTLSISIVAGLLFGIVPATATTRGGPAGFLKEGSRTVAGSPTRHRLSQGLVVAEVTLTLVLLAGAGLLARTFVALTGQETGFRTEGIAVVPLHVPNGRYESVPELERFWARVIERLHAVPGIESVAVANNLPIARGGATRLLELEGESAGTDARLAEYGVVSPDYFGSLEIPLLRGRYFQESDRRGAPQVAIIDAAMWRRIWPGQDPIGRRFRFVDTEEWMTVVGIVGDIRGRGLAEDPGPGFYIPYQQRPQTFVELATGHRAYVLAATDGAIASLGRSLRQAIWDVDPAQPVPEVTTLAAVLAERVGPERFRATLLGAFAAIALILVIAGIYGVVAYVVAERRHEFGIRRALGATGRNIVGNVLGWGLRLTGVGIALGLITVLAVNRYLASLLFGVAPGDPWTLAAAAAAVVLVTLAACLIPARTATRVNPMVALRAEGEG